MENENVKATESYSLINDLQEVYSWVSTCREGLNGLTQKLDPVREAVPQDTPGNMETEVHTQVSELVMSIKMQLVNLNEDINILYSEVRV